MQLKMSGVSVDYFYKYVCYSSKKWIYLKNFSFPTRNVIEVSNDPGIKVIFVNPSQ